MLRRSNGLWLVLANIVEIAACVVLVALCLDVLAGVVFRYFLGRALPWYEEAARYMFVWVSFLGAAIGVKRRSHFRFDLAVDAIPPGLRRWADLLADVGIAAFAALLVREGLNLVEATREQVSLSMGISVAWLYLSAPVSGALMLIYVLPQIARKTQALVVRKTTTASSPAKAMQPVAE